MKLEVTDSISEQELNEVYRGLLDYNTARIEDRNVREFGVFYKDENGHALAGLIGETRGNWLTVKYLWVAEELRERHIGSAILEQAEQTAKERGCRFVFLDTFDFQAPDFYKKHGYEEVFALTDYPITGKRYYYTKKL